MFTLPSVLHGTCSQRFTAGTLLGRRGTGGEGRGHTSEGVVTETKPEATRDFTGRQPARPAGRPPGALEPGAPRTGSDPQLGVPG